MQLDGISIVDLTRLLPGPYATQLLVDMGADVVKIEDTDLGDYARHFEPMGTGGVGAVFGSVNRGKRSVALDLKAEPDREAFYQLVSDADAVVEGFRPGVASRLGVDYESVRAYNPDVVYCSLSGFGQQGPYRDRAGHDINYAAMTGLLDMTRTDEHSKPTIPGYPIGDMAGGTFAALSVVSALLSRELGTTEGNYVDVSMTDALLSFSQAIAPLALAGMDPRPGETELTGKFPCYDVYETADGRYLTIGALEPKFWRALCDTLGHEELIDEHRASDRATREAVRETLAETFRSKSLDAWIDTLGDAEVTFAPVRTPAEAMADPHVTDRDVLRGDEETGARIGYPASARHGLDATEESIPDHGEHTRDALEAAGVDDATIRRVLDRSEE